MTPILEGLRTGAWRLVLVEMTPLEWEENKSAREKICKQWLANTPFGTIWIEHKKKFWISSDGVGQWRIYHETLEHAKAAAQADYEARILSALSASPDATAALLAEIEGLRGAVAAVTDATSSYLPPDGISAPECISRVIAATDNPEINAIMIGDRNGTP